MQSFVIASIFRRALASVIDFAITSVITAPIALIFPESRLMLFISFLVVTCCYHSFFITSFRCSSVGQKMMKLLVVTRCGNSIDIRTAFDRTITQFLCPSVGILLMQITDIIYLENITLVAVLLSQMCLAIFWGYWYILALFLPMRQTFHDLICNTIVIVK